MNQLYFQIIKWFSILYTAWLLQKLWEIAGEHGRAVKEYEQEKKT